MAWTNIPNANLAAGAPIRSVDLIALRDNIAAQANGDAGAPKTQNAAIASGIVNSLNGQSGAITNTSYDVIGSYVSGIGNAGLGVGAVVSGSSISVYSTGTGAAPLGSSAGTLSGTWRQMGAIGQAPASSKAYYKISLYVRIS